MASQRALRLAELLAEGVEAVEACRQAGWPESTAVWLGPMAHDYLAKAGITVDLSAPAPAQVDAPVTAEAGTGESAESVDAPSAAAPAPSAPKTRPARGRPNKE